MFSGELYSPTLGIPRSHSSFRTFPRHPGLAASIPIPHSGHFPWGRHFAPSTPIQDIGPVVGTIAPPFPFLIQDISLAVNTLGPQSHSGHCNPRPESRPWERARNSPFRIQQSWVPARRSRHENWGWTRCSPFRTRAQDAGNAL